MHEERYNKIITPIFVFFVVFSVGFGLGQKNSDYSEPKIALENATSTAPLDFGPFWQVWNILDERFSPKSTTTPTLSSQDKLWGAVSGLTGSYGDPYTVFLPPVESKMFEEEISGSFGGVGMEIAVKDEFLTVVSPLKGTPAERAGVLPGDKIVTINDTPALKMSADEAVNLIRGKEGTSVKITFAREGESELLIKTLVRAAIEIPTVDTKLTKEGVFVISLYNFSANSPNLFRNSLREFVESGSDKLVLDLRNNPGGFLEASLDMASWFLPAGKKVVTEDFGKNSEQNVEYKSKGYDIFNKNLKMAILVNQGSASASEILAGALREHGVATLVGDRSFGKGSVQELLPITKETSLKVTVAHWLTPNGTSISDGGLVPDIEVKLTPENTKDGADPQLNAAIKYLLSK